MSRATVTAALERLAEYADCVHKGDIRCGDCHGCETHALIQPSREALASMAGEIEGHRMSRFVRANQGGR